MGLSLKRITNTIKHVSNPLNVGTVKRADIDDTLKSGGAFDPITAESDKFWERTTGTNPSDPLGDRDGLSVKEQETAKQAAADRAAAYGAQENYGLAYVDPASKHYASEMAAAVQRAEWEDYKRRYRPVENELMGSIGNPQVLNDALTRGQQAVSASFDTSAGVMQRGLSRLGVSMNPAEQAASERSLALEQARTGAAVDNMTRRNVKDRDLAIMGGGGLAMRADAKEIWK